MPPELTGITASDPAPGFGFHLSDSRLPVVVWAMIIAIACGHGLLRPGSHSTYPCFREGGLRCLAGLELYRGFGYSCRYSPLFHLLIIPLAVLPVGLGSLFWRLINVLVFLAGMHSWMRTLLPVNLSQVQKNLLILLPIPVAFGSLFNGQSNLLMVGLMLLTMSAIHDQQWNRAAFWLALSCMIKLYPLALGLVLLAVYPRRFGGRFLICLVLGLALPFVMHDPGYIGQQYANWWRLLRTDNRTEIPIINAYRDLWLLSRRLHLPIGITGYHVIQLGSAFLVAVASWWTLRHGSDRSLALHATLSFTCLWIILCGPVTESCTYVVLGPTLAWTMVDAWRSNSPRALKGLLLASYTVLLSCLLAGMFPFVTVYHSYGPHPVAALLLTAALVWQVVRQGGFRTRARGAPLTNQAQAA